MNYPIYLRVSHIALRELVEAEEDSYMDALRGNGNTQRDPRTHAHAVASRCSTRLRIDSDQEAADMYDAVCSGTMRLTHLAVARRIADWLRLIVTRVDPSLVKTWPEPTGH